MVSDAVLETTKELIRQNESGRLGANALGIQVLKLQRATVLSSKTPSADVADVRDTLELHADVRARPVVEGVTARVMDAFDLKDDDMRDKKEVTEYLDSLVERMATSAGDLVEQVADCLTEGDCIMVVPQRESETNGMSGDDGNVIERSIIEAADIIMQQKMDAVNNEGGSMMNNNNKKSKENDGQETLIKVMVVRVHPDDNEIDSDENNEDEDIEEDQLGSADQMVRRLERVSGVEATVIDDSMVTRYMRQCTKVIIYGWMLDVDEGIGCRRGSAMLVGVANRQRVNTIAVVSKFRIMPMGSKCVQGMAMTQRFPGKVWAYDVARDDERRESVTVLAPMIDVVATHKMDEVITETGGYASDYLVNLMPAYERTMAMDDDDGCEEDEQSRSSGGGVGADRDGDGEDDGEVNENGNGNVNRNGNNDDDGEDNDNNE